LPGRDWRRVSEFPISTGGVENSNIVQNRARREVPSPQLAHYNRRELAMMNRIRIRTLAVFAVFLGSLAASAASGQTRQFSFAYDQPTTTAYGIAANIFDAKLKELSGGTMSINQFPGAQLGQEPQALQKMRAGDIDFVITSTANASTLAPQAGVFSLHFIFRDQAHLQKVLADPAINAEFRAMIKDQVQGAQVLGLMTMGMRNMYSKKEVTKIEDIKNQKVRVQATKTEDTLFPAYGAQTVHMPFGEVYTSLQTGVVNIAENGVNVYLANKHYEVAPILSMTEHEANNNCIWVSQKTWDSLTPQQQQWVQAAADEVSKKEPAMALKLEKDSADKLKTMGVKVVENVDKTGFVKAAAPIQDQLAAELGPHAVKLLKLVREVQ
jgi:tripartite ATP-independent transporter DctP family solute receptor